MVWEFEIEGGGEGFDAVDFGGLEIGVCVLASGFECEELCFAECFEADHGDCGVADAVELESVGGFEIVDIGIDFGLDSLEEVVGEVGWFGSGEAVDEAVSGGVGFSGGCAGAC